MIIFCTGDSACLKFGGVFPTYYSLLVHTTTPKNTLTIFTVFRYFTVFGYFDFDFLIIFALFSF